MSNPDVLAALVSGVVSLFVACFSGLYVLIRTNRRIGDLRSEMIEAGKTERMLKSATIYRESFRQFEATGAQINSQNPQDGTRILQHFIDFYGNTARPFYLDNPTFLQTPDLDRIVASIASRVDSGRLNVKPSPTRDAELRDLANDMLDFSKQLYESARKL